MGLLSCANCKYFAPVAFQGDVATQGICVANPPRAQLIKSSGQNTGIIGAGPRQESMGPATIRTPVSHDWLCSLWRGPNWEIWGPPAGSIVGGVDFQDEQEVATG